MELSIPIDAKFVLNAQGSTYNKQIWLLLISILKTKKCFSVSSTGRKEDPVKKIFDSSGNPCGYTLGYVDGYYFSQSANVIIHHGGFGTISQWIMGVVNRMNAEKDELERRITDSTSQDVKEFLSSCIGSAKSIAICNTFEQENNARTLNESAGGRVCTVAIADQILQSKNPHAVLSALVEEALSEDVTEEEINFWINTVTNVSVMDAPLHSALILERVMLSQD